jgi:hypothetical protein
MACGTNELNNNDPVAFFNGSGVQIASGTYDNTTLNTFTPSPALTAGQIVYGVYTYKFSNVAGTTTAMNKTMWPSRTRQKMAPSTIPMVADIGAAGGSNMVNVYWNNTVNQIGGPSDYTVWNAGDTASLFTGTATTGSGTAVIHVTLSGALAASTSYRLHVAAGSVQNSSTLQPNPAQNVPFTTPSSTPAIAIATGPGAGSTTSNTTPTWTGTASTNSGATITSCAPGVQANLDFAGFSCSGVTIISGNGTANVSWSYTPTGALGNGDHCLNFQVTDSLTNSANTGTFCFTENGAPLNLVSAITDPSGVYNYFSIPGILLTFDGPVYCPNTAGDAAAWSFSNTYDGPGPKSAGGAAGGVWDSSSFFPFFGGTNQCELTGFTGGIQVNDYGAIAYAQPATASDQVKGNPGPVLASQSHASPFVTENSPPQFASLSTTNASTTITVTYAESILCSSLDANGSDFSVTVAGVADAVVSAACAGTITAGQSVTVNIVLLTAPVTGTAVVVTSQAGGDGNTVRDKFGNFQPIGQTVSHTT